MIVCPRCSKENQDHYKFCLGCGAELPRDAAHAPKPFTAPTPPAGFPTAQAGAAAKAPPAAPPPAAAPPLAPPAPAPAPSPPARPAQAAAGGALVCPKCSNAVPRDFKFCGTCGNPMAAPAAPAAVAAPPAPRPTAKHQGSLVLIRPDGSEGGTFSLTEASTVVGRETGGLFATDSYLSPRHATFTFDATGLSLKDENSLNGVYVRIERDAPTELEHGSVFRIGQEILRFERIDAAKPGADGVEAMGAPNDGVIGRISLIIGRESNGNAIAITTRGLHLGRERGDVLFPEDGYVSGLHCKIGVEGNKVTLTDVGSSNGTFVRVKGKRALKAGDLVLMGQQLFRVEF